MSSVPLNHLLKIGAEVLSTTAQTLSGAINELKTALGTKQDTLTFDNAPTASSDNPVKSGGIKDALDGKSAVGHSHTTSDITDFPAINDGTLTIQHNGVTAGTFSANQSTNDIVNIITDTWTTASQVLQVGDILQVVFDDLSDNYGYDLYCDNKQITQVACVKSLGTNSGIKLTYTVKDVDVGDNCYLRILK